jgi:hypothetical protein
MKMQMIIPSLQKAQTSHTKADVTLTFCPAATMKFRFRLVLAGLAVSSCCFPPPVEMAAKKAVVAAAYF